MVWYVILQTLYLVCNRQSRYEQIWAQTNQLMFAKSYGNLPDNYNTVSVQELSYPDLLFQFFFDRYVE